MKHNACIMYHYVVLCSSIFITVQQQMMCGYLYINFHLEIQNHESVHESGDHFKYVVNIIRNNYSHAKGNLVYKCICRCVDMHHWWNIVCLQVSNLFPLQSSPFFDIAVYLQTIYSKCILVLGSVWTTGLDCGHTAPFAVTSHALHILMSF